MKWDIKNRQHQYSVSNIGLEKYRKVRDVQEYDFLNLKIEKNIEFYYFKKGTDSEFYYKFHFYRFKGFLTFLLKMTWIGLAQTKYIARAMILFRLWQSATALVCLSATQLI